MRCRDWDLNPRVTWGLRPINWIFIWALSNGLNAGGALHWNMDSFTVDRAQTTTPDPVDMAVVARGHLMEQLELWMAYSTQPIINFIWGEALQIPRIWSDLIRSWVRVGIWKRSIQAKWSLFCGVAKWLKKANFNAVMKKLHPLRPKNGAMLIPSISRAALYNCDRYFTHNIA